jgi:hypothetical protein
VETAMGILYDHAKTFGLVRCAPPETEFMFDLGNIPVTGDVAIRFFSFDTTDPKSITACLSHLTPGGLSVEYTHPNSSDVVLTGRQLCFIQFHTSFHSGSALVFSRREIDGAYNAKSKRFPLDFALSIEVSDLPLLQSRKEVQTVPACIIVHLLQSAFCALVNAIPPRGAAVMGGAVLILHLLSLAIAGCDCRAGSSPTSQQRD